MYFHGFAIEILEDGKQLREYCLQAKNTRTTTGKSYVIDEKTNERKYSPITAYAVVKETGKNFEIKYSAKIASEDNPIIAIIYIDGTNDYTYHGLTSSSSQIQNSFWDSSRDKQYCFEFSKILSYSPESSPNRIRTKPLYGARGTISVYFYKGTKVSERLMSIPYYALNQSRTIEPKFKSEISITTKFNEIIGNDTSPKPIINMIKQSNDPIAVLHIHYRSESWLVSIGMQIRINENSSTECAPNNSSFKPIPARNENELVSVSQSAVNNQSVNNGVSGQINQSLIDLIQSFEKMNNNNTSVDVTGVTEKESVILQRWSKPYEVHRGRIKKISHHMNKNYNKDKRFENFEPEGQRKNGKKKNKKRPRKKRSRKKERKVVTNTSIENEMITEPIKKEELSNPVIQSITEIPKYKEYVEREYHTSDYIEFDENNQILKKKTYCIEKTIIELEDD
ncbi:hypothetical protein C1645_737112 [Glomus cerebriforme]|uniref:Uncharacterized protein n=1 Tax=Glomus cerebriforme TaxID=658196 RepID=A0A397T3K2_9GLOM|nr:hypothetical protein C1645_737112 [Glomus cerebriforme]